MKISIAIFAFTALSSAGLYGTGVIGNDAYDSMVEAELTGDVDAEVEYALTMDDVFSKLVSIPVFEEMGRSPRKDIAPQIVISVKNNRQINWRMSVQNEHVADVIVNLVAVDALTTQVNLVVNIADNSILNAADANSDSDVDKLEKLSRILMATIIDQRLSEKQFDPNTIKSAYFADPNTTYLVTKLAAIDRVLRLRFGSSLPEPNIHGLYDYDDLEYDDNSPGSVTDPTDATIGEVEGEFQQDADWNAASYATEREIERAQRRAEAASDAVAKAAERAAEAADAAKRSAWNPAD